MGIGDWGLGVWGLWGGGGDPKHQKKNKKNQKPKHKNKFLKIKIKKNIKNY